MVRLGRFLKAVCLCETVRGGQFMNDKTLRRLTRGAGVLVVLVVLWAIQVVRPRFLYDYVVAYRRRRYKRDDGVYGLLRI